MLLYIVPLVIMPPIYVDREDVCLKHPFSMEVSGSRRSGKSQFLKNLTERNVDFITPHIEKIFWYYTSPQPFFTEIKQKCPNVTFEEGLPNEDIIEIMRSYNGSKLLIFDDLMHEVQKRDDIKHIFTRGRHENISIILTKQNLFSQGKHSRDIALNTDYLVLFGNVRDQSIISTLDRQMNMKTLLQKIYKRATTNPFSHLLINLRSDCKEIIRFRTKTFDKYPIFYDISKSSQ